MIPILYSTITEGTVPADYGIGALVDCLSCKTKEVRNDIYELEMEYAANGVHADQITPGTFVKAKPNYTDAPQLFQIYKVGKNINGRFTVYAQHISYLLSGKVITQGSANNIVTAIRTLLQSAAGNFTLETSKNTVGNFTITEPSSVRSWFGGKAGSLLDVYGGGEWHYDNFHAKLWQHRGEDRGVQIRYGKNLTELSQEIDMSNLVSGIIPFYKDSEGNVTAGSEVSTGLLGFTKTMAIDFSQDVDPESEIPILSQLTTLATAYISNNNFTSMLSNITLDFVQLQGLTERIDLCDTVHIYFEPLGISASMKCISTTWDVLAERYIETEFGDAKRTLADTVMSNSSDVIANKTDIHNAAMNAKAYTDAVKATLDDEIDDLQDQIDGNITTWYYDYAPTTSNLPASEWTTDEEKQKHSGDLFYDTTTQFCYRWTYQSDAWTWVLIRDTGIAQALAAAQAAQDTADNKRRIFIAEPTPPYDEGDLWIVDDNNIFVCVVSRASGSFDSDDWGSAVDAIDNDTMQSALEDAIKASTLLITGSTGGNVVLMRNIDSEGNYTTPYEIAIFDTHPNDPQDLDHAWHVWRWNMGGLAYSSEGYGGRFTTAITADGQIVADFITTGTLNAGAITVQGLKASMFEGQEIDLGGSANPNGVLKILDRSNNPLVVMNSDGVECFGATENNITPSVVFSKDGVIGYSNKDDKEHSAIFWTTKNSFGMKNAIIENELSVGGKFKLVPFTIRNSNNEIINDGIAEVPIN